MRRSAVPLVASVIFLASCGGASPAATDGAQASAPDGGASSQAPAASAEPPTGGDVLTPDDIVAAYSATEAQGAWMFEADVFTARSGGDLTITGTERRDPVRAVAAEHATVDGVFGYVRIGEDIWFDVAIGEWTQVEASGSENLIDQYEPYHLGGLVAYATVTPSDVYDFVAEEDMNGVSTRHYRLSEADREHTTQALGLTPDQWAGDVWIATDGGYLVAYVWGPQSLELIATTGGLGFSYDGTDFGCSCPVEPPE